MIITWTITQCDRLTSDNFITTAHWTCSAADGEYSSSIINTCSWNPGTPTIPYDQVTQNDVLNWIWTSGVDKNVVESAVIAQIEAQKNPTTATGLPW